MPDLEAKIGENNEILLRGKTITTGYYKNRSHRCAIDKDGSFHRPGSQREIICTDRTYLDLFKTSQRKVYSSEALETKLSIDRYIDQIAVIADQRKFVSALIVPVYGLVKTIC